MGYLKNLMGLTTTNCYQAERTSAIDSHKNLQRKKRLGKPSKIIKIRS